MKVIPDDILMLLNLFSDYAFFVDVMNIEYQRTKLPFKIANWLNFKTLRNIFGTQAF